MKASDIRHSDRTSAVFDTGYRASGILLHVTSLPSIHGIGAFGPEAIQWIDRLADAGQKWWQILPIGPPDKGNSPYTPLSTFACNPLLISPEWLVEDGLLVANEIQPQGSFTVETVDFEAASRWKEHLLAIAFQSYKTNRAGAFNRLSDRFHDFCESVSRWLDDFALFVALKQKFQFSHYLSWPKELVSREESAIDRASDELAIAIEQVKFEQFLVFQHLQRVREHAASRQVKLFGDLPIFVSHDSSEVWSHPDLFQLDEQLRPKFSAGVPPDYFSETGQLWGNPVYDWAALRRSGYAWWIDRLRSMMNQHDLVRLDHFRGFSAAWHVPAGEKTAVNGEWVPGPGAEFFDAVEKALAGLPFVAEDLGTITDDVRELLALFKFPKMGVLQFAFDGDVTNAFLPHHSVENMVMYTGTHDNDTSTGWYDTLAPNHREYFWNYLKRNEGKRTEVAWIMLELAWNTQAAIAIAPLQDLLALDSRARMNTPGIADGNWAWRCSPEQMQSIPWDRLKQLTTASGR